MWQWLTVAARALWRVALVLCSHKMAESCREHVLTRFCVLQTKHKELLTASGDALFAKKHSKYVCIYICMYIYMCINIYIYMCCGCNRTMHNHMAVSRTPLTQPLR